MKNNSILLKINRDRAAISITAWSLASLLLILQTPVAATPECDAWFKKHKVFENKTCSAACGSLPLDFSTISCEGECQSACQRGNEKDSKIMEEIVGLYPALTSDERTLATAHPADAITAYRLSWEAESACKTLYKTSDTNDESDACRHYMWAGLLSDNSHPRRARAVSHVTLSTSEPVLF